MRSTVAPMTHMYTCEPLPYAYFCTHKTHLQPLYGYSTSQPPDLQSIHESGLFSLHDHDVRVTDTALASPPDPHALPTPPSVQGSSCSIPMSLYQPHSQATYIDLGIRLSTMQKACVTFCSSITASQHIRP